MAMVLIIGCIDLSVGSVLALSGCVCVSMIESGIPTAAAVIITLVFGAFCGIINGLLATFTTIPSFIITLATQQCFRGAAYLMTNGKSIMCYDETFSAIGTGYIGPVPILGIVIIVCLVFTSILLNKTKFGRGMYAIGGNRSAAVYAGIKVKKIKMCIRDSPKASHDFLERYDKEIQQLKTFPFGYRGISFEYQGMEIRLKPYATYNIFFVVDQEMCIRDSSWGRAVTVDPKVPPW